MLRLISKILFSKNKSRDHQDEIQSELIKMSEKAKAIASDYETKINGIKEALVHLVGEYCIRMVELKEHYNTFDSQERDIDQALRGNKDEIARMKLLEKVSTERKIQACVESIEILVPKIKELYQKKVSLSSAQSEAMHRAGMMEARARSSEAIGRANSIMGDASMDIKDFGLESLNASVEKLEAYQSAVEEVHNELEEKPVAQFDAIEQMLQERKKALNISES